MASFKASQPRAAVAMCWICDRQLFAGGRIYTEVLDEAGNKHPAHRRCAEEQANRDEPKHLPSQLSGRW